MFDCTVAYGYTSAVGSVDSNTTQDNYMYHSYITDCSKKKYVHWLYVCEDSRNTKFDLKCVCYVIICFDNPIYSWSSRATLSNVLTIKRFIKFLYRECNRSYGLNSKRNPFDIVQLLKKTNYKTLKKIMLKDNESRSTVIELIQNAVCKMTERCWVAGVEAVSPSRVTVVYLN